MATIRASLASLLCLGICLSCQKKDPQGSSTFLIPWPTHSAANELEYRLQPVTLTTLSSPFELKGEAAEVYFGTGLTDHQPEGKPVKPRMTEVDGVYIPKDIESAFSIAAYAHFENLLKYERGQGIQSALSWPRKVSIETPFINERGQRELNQARYLYNEDVVSVSPSDTLGLAMALNGGILAHEHFHAIFEALFMKPLRKIMDPQSLATFDLFKDLSASSYRRMNVSKGRGEEAANQRIYEVDEVILRGWNEGLADFYAASYLDHPQFLSTSVTKLVEDARRLDIKAKPLLERSSLSYEVNLYRDNPDCLSGYCVSYREGTQVARWLFQMSRALSVEERKIFLTEIISRLPQASTAISQRINLHDLQSSFIIPLLVSENWVLKTNSCKSLKALYEIRDAVDADYPGCNSRGER